MNDKERQDFFFTLEKAMAEAQGDSAFRMDRNRPYNGQPHTDSGERGKTEIKGITMRDMSDCIVKGFLLAAGLPIEKCIHDDIYKIDMDIDPGAVIQNALVEAEKMMGIYPNIPKLKGDKKGDKVLNDYSFEFGYNQAIDEIMELMDRS